MTQDQFQEEVLKRLDELDGRFDKLDGRVEELSQEVGRSRPDSAVSKKPSTGSPGRSACPAFRRLGVAVSPWPRKRDSHAVVEGGRPTGGPLRVYGPISPVVLGQRRGA